MINLVIVISFNKNLLNTNLKYSIKSYNFYKI